ncbi:MAG: substrate-binding domain-containing protein [Deltaproteobacteria bacterium]|nr:substrate-binding domain-containing protein [Deltaproteobacteria bacterium]
MRIALFSTILIAITACDRQVVTQLSECQRSQGANEVYLTKAKSDLAQCEQKIAVLEEQLKTAQDDLSAARNSANQFDNSLPEYFNTKGGRKKAAMAGGTLRIGLSLPTHQEERWIKDKLTILAEGRKRGFEILVQVSDNDAVKQAAQCDSMIAQRIKVLILAPVNADSAAAIIDRSVKAGVHVISYDRLVTNSPHEYYYLSFDNVRVGAIQGEFITRKARRGNYVVLAGSPTDNNAKLLKLGSMKFIQPLVDRGNIKIVLSESVKDWRPDEAQRLCEHAIEITKGKINAVLAPNDGTAGGCIKALAAHGLAGKVPITGQDADLAAAIRILQGTQSMTVFKDTRLLGKRAVEMAFDLFRGRSVETRGRTIFNNKRQIPAVLLSPRLVTKDNLNELLIRSGYLNKEAVYRR